MYLHTCTTGIIVVVRHSHVRTYSWMEKVMAYAWQAVWSTKEGWSTGVCFGPLSRRSRGICKGEVLGLRVHKAGSPGRVITMRPATVSTAVAPRHKDTPLQRHDYAFVLPHTLSVLHSRGLERHHRVPIKPLVVEDSSDSLIHNTYTHTLTYEYTQAFKIYTCTVSTQMPWDDKSKVLFTYYHCQPFRAWMAEQSVIYVCSLSPWPAESLIDSLTHALLKFNS